MSKVGLALRAQHKQPPTANLISNQEYYFTTPEENKWTFASVCDVRARATANVV